jgi:N6-L-threonylcarbamoyladenine synthase
MKILAFETSCDDTSIAVVEDGVNVLAHVKQSQTEHNAYGGVVPEIAARLHAENWRAVLQSCLTEANLTIEEIDALAVTSGPGLQTSLLTGTTAASFLALLKNKPLIPVHHVLGHMASVALDRTVEEFQFPAITFTASGGHSDFFVCESFTDVKKVGQTIDDAAGEAFDKCAKMLGLGYPGGPIVSERAEKGDPTAFDFPVILLEKDSLNFSFSGLKAAIYRTVEKCEDPTDETFINNVCSSFQSTVVKTCVKKLERAFEMYPDVHSFHFVGGVSANKQLREALKNTCEAWDKKFFTTSKFVYSTDNAAMIGSAAYFLYEKNPEIAQVQFIDPNPRLVI